jgi:hypothetical protein
MEHAQAFEPIQDGRIYIEKLNGPFLFGDKGTPAGYSAGLVLAIKRGWLDLHESGTYVKVHGCRRRTVRLTLQYGRYCLGPRRCWANADWGLIPQ